MSASTTLSPVAKAALKLIDKPRNLKVLPLYGVTDGVCECSKSDCTGTSRGKHPCIKGWTIGKASNQRAVVYNWFAKQFPSANLGVFVTDGLVVIDLDGPEKITWWAERVGEFGPHRTWITRSGRPDGGYHVWFRVPLGTVVRESIGPGIEVKGKGTTEGRRQVVVPPSVHYSGSTYQWAAGGPWEMPEGPAEAPAWVLTLVTTAAESPNGRTRYERFQEVYGAGERHDRIVHMAGTFNSEGIPLESAEIAVLGFNRTQCVPSLAEEVVLAQVRDVYERYQDQHGQGPASRGDFVGHLVADQSDDEPGDAAQPENGGEPVTVNRASPSAQQDRDAPRQVSTWRPVNLVDALACDGGPLEPTTLRREDGIPLLYPGKVHSFIGEPESGKSWIAQLAGVEVVKGGGTWLLIDGEKDARDLVGRLAPLGVTPQMMAENLLYVRPEEPFTPTTRAHLFAAIEGRTLDITVIDSVETLMTASGLDPSSRKDYGGWHAQLVRPLQVLTAGPTVLIDHPIKDTEKRGAWASGAGNKRALVDVSFLVDRIAAFGRGREGSARIMIAKDSPAGLRQHELATGGIAVFRLAEADGKVMAELRAATVATPTVPKMFRPTHLMERVSRHVEEATTAPTKYRILEDVSGNRGALGVAVDVLVTEGYLACVPVGRGSAYRSLKPYREADDDADRSLGSGTGS